MLAIIIPYYKHTFFEAVLESIANQSDRRFKVYIGDDASSENPSDLIEKFQGKIDFIYNRFEENLGGISLVKQWERCVALSVLEEWIMILGDDDVLSNNVVETFYENLEEIKSVSNVVRFASFKIDNNGKEISSIYCHPKVENSTDSFFRETRSSLSEYIFNKKQVLEIGFKDFPLAWLSDVLAVLEFSDFKNVFSINEAHVYIRITDLSISGKKDNLKIKSKAVFEFYYYLLSNKSDFFTIQQKKILLTRISKCYINDKRKWSYFLKISKIFITNFYFVELYSFFKSISISLIKRVK